MIRSFPARFICSVYYTFHCKPVCQPSTFYSSISNCRKASRSQKFAGHEIALPPPVPLLWECSMVKTDWLNNNQIGFNIFWVPLRAYASDSIRCSKPALFRPAWRGPGSASRTLNKLRLSSLSDRCCSRLCCYRYFHIFSQTFDSLTLLSIQRTDHITKNISNKSLWIDVNVTL